MTLLEQTSNLRDEKWRDARLPNLAWMHSLIVLVLSRPLDNCRENAESVLARLLRAASPPAVFLAPPPAVPLAPPPVATPPAIPLPPAAEGKGLFDFHTSCELCLLRALTLAEEGTALLVGLVKGAAAIKGCGLLDRLLLGREPEDLDGEGFPATASKGRRSLDGESDEEERAEERLARPEGNLGGPGDCAEGNLGGPGDCAEGNIGEPGDCAEGNLGGPGDCAERNLSGVPGDCASPSGTYHILCHLTIT